MSTGLDTWRVAWLRRLTFRMSAPAGLTGRARIDVLPAEVAAVLTLLSLTAASLVRAVLHPRTSSGLSIPP
jgi:hypothetical protein